MLDELFFKEKMQQNTVNFIFFGFIITVFGFLTSIIFFRKEASIVQILIITILLMPVIMQLLQKEERITRKSVGLRKLYSKHKCVFASYFMLFIGVFLAFLLIQLLTITNVSLFNDAFGYQLKYLAANENQISGAVDEMLDEIPKTNTLTISLAIHIAVLIITFILSFVYGSGGVFLLIMTASIFSSLLIFVMRMFSSFAGYSFILLLMFLLVFIPLSIAFILSAIAGGIISRAIVVEKLWSKNFKNVVYDGFIILIISIISVVLIHFLRIILLRIAVSFL